MSPAEMREKLRKELASTLPGLDPLDQTDDNVFALFDAGDDV